VSSEPSEALRKYIEAKMELSMQRPNASRVFAMEIISGAPVIGDYLATELKSWVDKHVLIFRDGKTAVNSWMFHHIMCSL
jgi:TetR/AcrR family transcriptional regulator